MALYNMCVPNVTCAYKAVMARTFQGTSQALRGGCCRCC